MVVERALRQLAAAPWSSGALAAASGWAAPPAPACRCANGAQPLAAASRSRAFSSSTGSDGGAPAARGSPATSGGAADGGGSGSDRAASGSEASVGGSSSGSSGDGLLAGGIWAELRSWGRFLMPGSRYKAVFYPTPEPVVAAMLRLAAVGPGDVVYDLGCGDGRIVIAAAQQFGAHKCVGIELDPQLATAARAAVAAAGLSDSVTILQGDAAAADLSGASVVAVYLSEAGNRELLAAVSGSLPRGARVVSHYFGVAGWERQLRARDASAGIELYLYEAP